MIIDDPIENITILSDYISLYAKNEKMQGNNNEFTVASITLNTLPNFRKCIPEVCYFEQNDKLTIRENLLNYTNIAFKYLIEKILLEYNFNVLTSIEESTPTGVLNQGVLHMLNDDYSEWIINNIKEMGIFEHNVNEFFYNLTINGVLEKSINQLNTLLVKYSKRIIYPLKWEEYDDTEDKKLYVAILNYDSSFYIKYNLETISNIDFRLIKNGRLIA